MDFGFKKKKEENEIKNEEQPNTEGLQAKDQGVEGQENDNSVEENAAEKTEELEQGQDIENKEVESTENFGEKNDEKSVEEQAEEIKENVTEEAQDLAKAFEAGELGIGEGSKAPTAEMIEKAKALEEEVIEDKTQPDPEPELSPNGKAILYVKDLRLGIDKSMQLGGNLHNVKVELTNSLFNAKCWLGKALAELGTVNPYITEKPVKFPKEIPPTADVYDNPKFIYDFKNKNQIERVLYLRDYLGDAVKILANFGEEGMEVGDGRMLAIALTQCYVNLSEARFELGAELGRIRNANQ